MATLPDWIQVPLGLLLAGTVFVLWLKGLAGAYDAEQARKAAAAPPRPTTATSQPAATNTGTWDALLLLLTAIAVVGIALALDVTAAGIMRIAFIGVVALTLFYRWRNRHDAKS